MNQIKPDPLHVPHHKLVVRFNDVGTMLSKSFMDKQNAWLNLEALKEVHYWRLGLEEVMKNSWMVDDLEYYDSLYTGLEFMLQELWLLPQDSNYHKFWNRPRCQCPRMDNNERYPTGYYVIMASCPVHGGKVNGKN